MIFPIRKVSYEAGRRDRTCVSTYLFSFLSFTISSMVEKTTALVDVADKLRRRKITKKGFRLCVMVCGRAGTGKSTFLNSLCDGEVYPTKNDISFIEPTRDMQIRTQRVDLGEADGTVISLTVVDTPGFGDKINNGANVETLVHYLETQFDEVLRQEALVCRNPRFEDHRVHACLYFLPPTNQGLRELDIEVMSKLSSRVNIIPVISKADTLTETEMVNAKKAVMESIQAHNIPIFTFNYDLDDEESMEENAALREMLPFAVVGSNSIYQVENVYTRAREYPWGFVRVEDPLHSDFTALRSVLFGSHIQELRDTTQFMIYEKYRTEQLYKDPELLARLRNDGRVLMGEQIIAPSCK